MDIFIAMHRAPDHATVKDYANDAVNNFKEHENITLDYSIDSLKHIDAVLLGWKNQGVPVSQINKSLFAMASYAGETVLRHLPGQWQANPAVGTSVQQAFMFIQFNNGVIWRPIYQVFALMLSPAAHNPSQTLQASLEFALSGLLTPASANANIAPASEAELLADYRIRFVLNDDHLSLPTDNANNSQQAGSANPNSFQASKQKAGILSGLSHLFNTRLSRRKPGPQINRGDSGFIAGTLVHTKNGLVPIEQIKVGDLVLSKPENGGELAYKRVLKTLAYESKRIMEITYKIPQTNRFGFLCATPNHPFWLIKDGWTAVKQLECTEYPVLLNHAGSEVKIDHVRDIYITDQSDVGWVPNYETMLDEWGTQLRFNPIQTVVVV